METCPKLPHPPIVEAVVDIQCELPQRPELRDLEVPGRTAYGDAYPQVRLQHLQQVTVRPAPGESPAVDSSTAVQALQFLADDGRQLVQIRADGYSFNRLAPYTSLDDYYTEIERTWRLFVGVAAPLQVREVRLRYINRIPLPMEGDRVDLDRYLTIGPRVPSDDTLTLVGFLDQKALHDTVTGAHVQLILAADKPTDGKLPVILDVQTASSVESSPGDWGAIYAGIESLRHVKNRVFKGALTELCMRLFD